MQLKTKNIRQGRTLLWRKKQKTRCGFTTVEMLVSIALFSIVVSIAVGGITRALRTQRHVTALISANSNASLAIEQIAREIRTGFDFECVPDFLKCSELRFVNSRGENINYRLQGEVIERGSSSSFERMTASNVRVSNLIFTNYSKAREGEFPPRIVIYLEVSPKIPGLNLGATSIQTTVSAREF